MDWVTVDVAARSITPDKMSIKRQEKSTSSNTDIGTSTTVNIAALSFSGLSIGKKYTYKAILNWNYSDATSASGRVIVTTRLSNGSATICEKIIAYNTSNLGEEIGTVSIDQTFETSVSTTANLNIGIDFVTGDALPGGSNFQLTGDADANKASLEEADYYVDTTDWT